MQRKVLLFIGVLIAITALTRLFPVAWNFSPMAAIALMGGFFFKDIKKAILIPLACLLVSDTLLHIQYLTGASEWPGLYPEISLVYLAYVLIVLIGRNMIASPKWLNVIGAALVGSFAFFLITNFAVWMAGHTYPMDLNGLVSCYVAAVPFFRMTLLGNLVYSVLFFGAFKAANSYWNVNLAPHRSLG